MDEIIKITPKMTALEIENRVSKKYVNLGIEKTQKEIQKEASELIEIQENKPFKN